MSDKGRRRSGVATWPRVEDGELEGLGRLVVQLMGAGVPSDADTNNVPNELAQARIDGSSALRMLEIQVEGNLLQVRAKALDAHAHRDL